MPGRVQAAPAFLQFVRGIPLAGKNGLPKEDWQQPERFNTMHWSCEAELHYVRRCIALPVVTQDRDFSDPRNSRPNSFKEDFAFRPSVSSRLIEQGLNAEDLRLLEGHCSATAITRTCWPMVHCAGYADVLHSPDLRWNLAFGKRQLITHRTAHVRSVESLHVDFRAVVGLCLQAPA